jgi:hypothetical protein
MERHDWLTTPVYGDSGKPGPRRGAVFIIVYRISRTHVREMKDDVTLGVLFLLAPLSLSCNPHLSLGL